MVRLFSNKIYQNKNMEISSGVLVLVKGILSRLIFFSHGAVSIYFYTQTSNDNSYWSMMIPVVLLLIESVVVLVHRKGKEYKYFWSSGFLYITCIIQIIWSIEMDLFVSRERNEKETKIEQNYTLLSLSEKEKLDSALYLYAYENSKNSSLKKICEIGIILGVLSARWIMTRGSMSKKQLSSLLLLQVGNAADILELFDVFDEPAVIKNHGFIIATIGIFTWSMFQFTLFTTASTTKEIGEIKIRHMNEKLAVCAQDLNQSNSKKIEYIKDIRRRSVISSPLYSKRHCRGNGKKRVLYVRDDSKYVNNNPIKRRRTEIIRRKLHAELFQILVTLLMQDGPYLFLRVFLLVKFNISSEMHVFFMCKNSMMSLFLVYRLLILSCHGKDEVSMWHREENQVKLHNVQIAMNAFKLESMDMEHVLVK